MYKREVGERERNQECLSNSPTGDSFHCSVLSNAVCFTPEHYSLTYVPGGSYDELYCVLDRYEYTSD